MLNPMKYIRDLEAAGFERAQAEAQVQLVFDAMTNEVASKSDVAGLKQDVGVLKQDVAGLKQDVGVLKQDVAGLKQDVGVLKQDVAGLKQDVVLIKQDIGVFKQEVAAEFGAVRSEMKLLELRLTVKLGALALSCTTIAVSILAWLITIKH